MKQALYTKSVFYLTTALLFISSESRAEHQSSRLGPREGYISSIEEDKNIEYKEILLPLEPIPQPSYPTWFKRIFDDDELAREFKERYERQFGRTEAEQAQSISNPFVVIDVVNPQGQIYRGTLLEDQTQRQRFAEYMIRRMVEHNVDKFVKNEPSIRPIYEIKERISKAEVYVRPGYSLALNYSFSGNNLRIRPVNPYVILEILLEMPPTQMGPGSVYETHWRLGQQITKKFSANVYFRQNDAVISLVLRQEFTSLVAATLTTSTFTNSLGRTPRETLVLAGTYWQF